MVMARQVLQPKTDEVVSKIMDGEAIIINLANGVYYSTDNVGAFIWEMIGHAQPADAIADAITERYDVPRQQAHADLEHLLAELIREELVAMAEGAVDTSEPPLAPAQKLSYQTPMLNTYRDMGDLLALDPPTPGLDSPWKDPGERQP